VRDAKVIARAVAVARDVRADLLARPSFRRDLKGQCALAALHVAVVLRELHALRVGFFMKRGVLYGRCGRFPYGHAWCQVGGTIVDPTATQFGRYRAVHVVAAVDTDHYVETGRGTTAIREILTEWPCEDLPAYEHLAQELLKKSKTRAA